MISTKNLSPLAEPEALKQLTRSLAILGALIQPEWEYRLYLFNSKWSAHEQMASMRNGQGDAWFCVFSSVGAPDHNSIWVQDTFNKIVTVTWYTTFSVGYTWSW